MPGTDIAIKAADGGSIPCYLATPDGGAGAGVILVTTIIGLDDDTRSYADDLAGRGFVAAAPDMFWRDHDPGPLNTDEDGWKRAFARSGRSDIEQGMNDLGDMIADLRSRPECNGRIAVMGFCFGGPYALLGAARHGIDAGISFHGSHVGKYLGEAEGITCPMSFHYGDNDAVASMEEIGRIEAAFERLDDAAVFIYPGAVHGYMMQSRGDGYHPAAASASWERALKVLESL